MKNLYNKISNLFQYKYIYLFILLQPIIDIVTFFMKEKLNMTFTVGILTRCIFLIYSCVYLVFYDKKNKFKNVIYLIAIAIIFSINVIINFFVKDYIFSQEFINIFKIVFFPISLLFFYRFRTDEKGENKKQENKCLNYASISIGLTMFLSKLTGTQLCSYGNDSACIEGYSGWFYSANDYGSIVILLFSYMIYKIYKDKLNFINILSIICLIYAAYALGTKAPYLGFIVLLIFAIIYGIGNFLLNRNRQNLNKFSVFIVFLIATYLLTPSLPVCLNNYKLFKNVNIYCKIPIDKDKINEDGYLENLIPDDLHDKNDNKPIKKEELNQMVLNGRDNYLDLNLKVFNNSSFNRKLFGIGYRNNKLDNKIVNMVVERDFHDLFFQYGLFGFVIVLIPICSIAILQFKIIFRKFIFILKPEIISFLGILIVLGGAFISGHVLFSPAVTIYLSFILANTVFLHKN